MQFFSFICVVILSIIVVFKVALFLLETKHLPQCYVFLLLI